MHYFYTPYSGTCEICTLINFINFYSYVRVHKCRSYLFSVGAAKVMPSYRVTCIQSVILQAFIFLAIVYCALVYRYWIKTHSIYSFVISLGCKIRESSRDVTWNRSGHLLQLTLIPVLIVYYFHYGIVDSHDILLPTRQ